LKVYELAEVIARKAHHGQKRKISGDPYIIHPMRVFIAAQKYTIIYDDALAAAWLHDVLEDTDVSEKDLLRQGISERAVNIVKWLTKPEGKGLKRFERKYRYFDRLRMAPAIVMVLKLLDRLDNMSDIKDQEPDFQRLYAMESIWMAESMLHFLGVSDMEELAQHLSDRVVLLSRKVLKENGYSAVVERNLLPLV